MEQVRPYFLPLIIGAGTLFAWYNTFLLFVSFFGYYDTIFHFRDCIVPNPLLTPCLYGSVAFLVAFVWSLVLAISPSRKGSLWLMRLILFGVCFAAAVLVYEFLEFYKVIHPSTSVSCSPGVFPLYTPCFGGLLFFAASYGAGLVINKHSGTPVEE